MFTTILSILSDIMAGLFLQFLIITIFGITITIGTKKRAYTYSKGILSMAKTTE